MGKNCEEKPADPKETIVSNENRVCRDIIWLLLFVGFWAGMVVVAQRAIAEGQPQRLMYGVDSYGNVCGVKNPGINGSNPVDLTNKTNLYYLNPTQFFDKDNFLFAQTICVEECPGSGDLESAVCDSLPCNSGEQYRCPYYNFAESNLNQTLDLGSNEDLFSVQYYDELSSTTADCTGLPSLDLSQDNTTNINTTSVNGTSDGRKLLQGTTACGLSLQLKSQIPPFGPCYPVITKTITAVNRCIPAIEQVQKQLTVATNVSVPDYLSSNSLNNHLSDLQNGWLIVVIGGLVVGGAASITWMIILWFCAGIMAWVTIVVVNLMLIAVTILSFLKGGLFVQHLAPVNQIIQDQFDTSVDSVDDTEQMWRIISYIVAFFTVCGIIFTIVIIRRVNVAVACIKVASQAISVMPSILLFPLLPFLFQCILIVYWIPIMGYLYSAGDIAEVYKDPAGANSTLPCYDNPECRYDIQWNKTIQYMMFYHIFGLLWTNQFIVGFGLVVIAAAVSQFYWKGGDKKNMPKRPVMAAMWTTVRFHLGSVAFGALIVAIIHFIRLIIEYINRKTKKLQEQNSFLRFAMVCVRFCVWYLEQIVKFINRNAYILVGIKGYGYCKAATRAVQLIVANALRLVAVNVVGDYLLFLGKVCVMLGSGLIAFFLSDLPKYTDPSSPAMLHSSVLPILVAFLVGFMVAKLFFQVYEMAIDTVLLSFCEDCERNDGEPQNAPDLLIAAIGKQKRKESNKPTPES